MKKLIFLVTLAIVTGSMLTSFRTLPSAAAVHSNLPGPSNPQTFYEHGNLANSDARPIDASGPSCANPMPDEVRKCDELEQQILASTVRLEWHLWIKNDNGSGYNVDGSRGYATIKAGRYLVTHNHLGISLSDLKNGKLTTVSVSQQMASPFGWRRH